MIDILSKLKDRSEKPEPVNVRSLVFVNIRGSVSRRDECSVNNCCLRSLWISGIEEVDDEEQYSDSKKHMASRQLSASLDDSMSKESAMDDQGRHRLGCISA